VKIVDPLLFFQSLRDERIASARIGAILEASLRRVLGGSSFTAVVRDKRESLMKTIAAQVNQEASPFGVQIVDVRIKRVDLPEANMQAIYRRMQTERQREAAEFRAEGEGAARRIRGTADRQVTVIKADATGESERIRGAGDAERNRIFAEAFGQDPDFFAFYRSMQAYEVALKAGDTHLAAGELDAAEKAFKEAQALKVTDASPAKGLAKVTAARNAKGVETHLAAARDAEAKKEWADAIEAYDRALRLKPGDPAFTARRKELEQTHRPPKIQLKLSEATNISMELVLIKRGKFTMGDPQGGSDERPREVEIAKDFWMQTTELTQAQWELVMNTKPWVAASVPLLPVEGVSWEDAQKFIGKLVPLIQSQLQGRRLALPTEAEWEYACRAGSSTRWSFGNDESQFDNHGWNTVNATRAPQLVAKKRANPWGLFDMHGNVAEWCADEYAKPVDDAPALRNIRGGSWNDRALNCRSSKREKDVPAKSSAFLGFRVILRPP